MAPKSEQLKPQLSLVLRGNLVMRCDELIYHDVETQENKEFIWPYIALATVLGRRMCMDWTVAFDNVTFFTFGRRGDLTWHHVKSPRLPKVKKVTLSKATVQSMHIRRPNTVAKAIYGQINSLFGPGDIAPIKLPAATNLLLERTWFGLPWRHSEHCDRSTGSCSK